MSSVLLSEMSSVCPFPSCASASAPHTYSCEEHFRWSLMNHKETQNQFSVIGKTVSQLFSTRGRAQMIHEVLLALQAEGQRITRYLFTLLRYTIESRYHAITLFGTPLPQGEEARTRACTMEAFQWVVSTLGSMPTKDECMTLEGNPFDMTPALQTFERAMLESTYNFPNIHEDLSQWGLGHRNIEELTSVLRLCARTMLRFPRAANRPLWIRLGKQAIALQNASNAYEKEAVKNRTARFMESMGLIPEEEQEAEPMPIPEDTPPPPQGPLAAFAQDPQNVHTAPAQTQASAAIRVLMDSAPTPSWEACYAAFEAVHVGLVSGKRMRAFRDSLETDEPQEVTVHLDHAEPFLANITYTEMFCAAWSIVGSAGDDLDLQVHRMDDLAGTVTDGYCTTDMYRLEGMADFLCKWTGTLASQLATSGLTPLELWMKHRYNSLLTEILEAGLEVDLEEPEKTKMWFEKDLWTEFSWDVYNTYDFGTLYGDLLRQSWMYACSQPSPIKKEIVIRLAQEVVDGRGMCPQGKMTRLANVLRGFHSGLESVPVLSVKEQLQNRMAVIGALPLAERQAAADAVFAELGIEEADRTPWLEAVLEA